MNTILSICEEYSDNVWYSEFNEQSMPSKIAIEIEKKYKFNLLKTLLPHGYVLDGMRRVDEYHSILQLIKAEKSALVSDYR